MAELIGGEVAGWKVGATVRAVQVFEGHDGPLPGRIFADRLFDSPAKIPAKLFKGVKVECEFAFRLTRELPPGNGPVTRDQIADALTVPSGVRARRQPLRAGHRQPRGDDIRRCRR